MKRLFLSLIGLVAGSFLPLVAQTDSSSNQVWLDSLDLSLIRQSFGQAQANESVRHHPLTLGGKVYQHGVGTHAISMIWIDLGGSALSFQATVGVDNESKGKGSVIFLVMVDGKNVAETKILRGGGHPQPITVDLTGAKKLLLKVGDAGDGTADDSADWADASITLAPGAAQQPKILPPEEAPGRLTIPADDPKPALHGPRVTGATPGRPFLFLIPATGTAPLSYAAQNLPEGLTLNAATGIISGSLAHEGTAKTTLTVTNSLGSASRELTIISGTHVLAQTPPMGWNSWNVWARAVDAGKIRDAASQMIASGLAAHGYQYVNIDDCWQGNRDAQGNIQPNDQFPDMKALTDEIHAKGLKAGIYSSPGPLTCAGHTGSYKHEDQDAQTYAEWGFDFLKYDLCSYQSMLGKSPWSVPLQAAYGKMAAALDQTNRDILYSLCEYGEGKVWEWGANPDIHASSWRTGIDIDDVWTGSSSWGANRGVYNILEKEVGHEKFAGPGHWNDPDMLMVGLVGFGHPHPTELTKNEQITHVSFWCMLASPLLIGCDMTRLDAFTKAVLTNDELLDIDQDPLGHAAARVFQGSDGSEVWARDLSDGTHAVALLNPQSTDRTVTAKWSDIGISGSQPVRDLWLHKDLGAMSDSYSVLVPSHGTVVIKIGKPNL